jgi:hypothetical protein
VSELGSAVLQDAHSHPHDFRANAIARQQNNFPLLTGTHLINPHRNKLKRTSAAKAIVFRPSNVAAEGATDKNHLWDSL